LGKIALFHPLDRSFLRVPGDSADRLARSGQADAAFSIAMLGARAHKQVPTGAALHFGQWLGWPDWLREGTSLTEPGPLPPTVSVADELTIIGNIIDNADTLALVERMLTAPRPVLGTTAALSLLHAPDLGLALGSLLRAMLARPPYARIAIEEHEDTVAIAFLQPWPMGPLFRFLAIVGVTLIYRAIESAHCNDLADMTLETQLYGLPEAQPLLSRLQCRIAPATGAERLCFPRAWQAAPNLHHDPMLWAVARCKLAALENQTGEPEAVAAVRLHRPNAGVRAAGAAAQAGRHASWSVEPHDRAPAGSP